MRSVETVLLLVVLGTVVAVFAGRLQIPAPSMLVIAGLLIGLLPSVPAVRVPPEVVSLVVLPPLAARAERIGPALASSAGDFDVRARQPQRDPIDPAPCRTGHHREGSTRTKKLSQLKSLQTTTSA